VNNLVEALFTEEDRKNLKLIAEEVPKLRLLMDELLETLDVMSSKEELEAIKESLEQVRRGETMDWDEYLNELKKKSEI
jgi:PHD/YefM family antitoxin component YafN of YafNO toxin-antitoxin module